jgi:hypothetical protein
LIAVDVKFVKLVVSSEDYEEVRGIWRQRYNRYEDAILMMQGEAPIGWINDKSVY